MIPSTRRQIEEFEQKRPDPEQNPHEVRRINEEISRIIDEERAFTNASKGFRVA
ncbi:MAG TPA: hypothetical protein VFY63_16100 [Pseudorhizobium sp.]|nr:hypothetical protein [Pseudorhizobium sp.]